MSFIEKLKAGTEAILAKVGFISARVSGYVSIALNLAGKLQAAIANPTVELTIKVILTELGITDPNLEADIEAAMPKAIGYLTQSQEVLNAGTPDQMLQAFIKDIQTDLPTVQQSKIWNLGVKLVGILDGNSLPGKIYSLVMQKHDVAASMGIAI